MANAFFTPGPPERYRAGDVVHGYQLIEQVARSALGEVWWKVRSRDGRALVLRVASPNAVAPKHQYHWTRLRHPHLIAVIEVFRGFADRLHVVTELGEQSLADLLGQAKSAGGRGILRDDLLPLVRDTADALDYLHRELTIHRDVKPANLYVVAGRAKVILGDMRRAEGESPAPQTLMLGTPAYMAPEVWAGRVTPAVDQYSLALTYAELRQGRLPVPSATMTEIMFAHLEGLYGFDADVFTKDELAAVRRALTKEPGKRFETCSAFVRALG